MPELKENQENEGMGTIVIEQGVIMEKDKNNKNQTKNQKRKEKKKRRAQRKLAEEKDREENRDITDGNESAEDVQIEYVAEEIDIDMSNPHNLFFLQIMEKFKITEIDPKLEEELRKERERADKLAKEIELRKKPRDIDEEADDDKPKEKEEEKKDDVPKISKRKLKKLNRLSIAELKQQVTRPDVVEMHDVTAKDPKLLVHLKAYRNTVPVPRHWCFKRKYLQGKRGIEKPPFQLPEFIKRTGIMEMRQALQDKEEAKTLKAKMREKARPKMGKIDIDYQKLHDAFFKWQTKPRMTIHGDLYYEGKEYETKLKEKKPGDLSEDLRNALGMPTGSNAHKVPPPWLIAMQRYGPPPSYPNLKIPGLNAPIPDSCSFGYHAGGWGKPPVDEMGRPLYGDVFGTLTGDSQQSAMEEEVDKNTWGELESESESESEEEEEEEDEGEGQEGADEKGAGDADGMATPAEGLVTPSGLTSIPLGMETPDMIELRKRKIEQEMEGGETPALYTILPEKKVERMGNAMMASAHTYDLSAAMPGKQRSGAGGAVDSGIEIALDPSELELDHAAMAAHYEQRIREQNMLEKDHDLSDMVAEHAAKQKNKRKKAVQDVGGKSNPKKYKEFKF